MGRKIKWDSLIELTDRQKRSGKEYSYRAGQREYVFTKEEREEQDRVRRLNIANGVHHLVEERNSMSQALA